MRGKIAARRRHGVQNYGNSPLHALNDARGRAARLRPLRASDPDGPAMAAKKNVSTLQDLVDDTERVGELIGRGDSHLLIRSAMEPGFFNTKSLYDYSVRPIHTGQFICDVHEGPVALHPDTLIIWK